MAVDTPSDYVVIGLLVFIYGIVAPFAMYSTHRLWPLLVDDRDIGDFFIIKRRPRMIRVLLICIYVYVLIQRPLVVCAELNFIDIPETFNVAISSWNIVLGYLQIIKTVFRVLFLFCVLFRNTTLYKFFFVEFYDFALKKIKITTLWVHTQTQK